VARPGDELAAGVEERRQARCHLVERRAELGDLGRPLFGRACRKVALGERPRGGAQPIDGSSDRPADEQCGSDRDRRGGGRDGENDDVGAHMEHRHAREEHGRERKRDREQGQTGKSRADARQ
jgi:hypothetical protein